MDEFEDKISEALTTAELIEATSCVLYAWDVELNKIYTLLLEKLSDEDIEKLKEVQRLWIKEKEQSAKEYAVEFTNGSFAPVAFNDVLIQYTRQRKLELILIYFNNSKDFSYHFEPPQTYPDIDNLEFADLAGMKFTFSSGAGAWSTELEIMPDGSFTGYHHDSDMGDTGPGYPNGTRYHCNFSGKFSFLQKTGDYEYSLKCESITQEDVSNEIEIGTDGIRYIASYAYGLDDADILFLYLPGKDVSELPEEFLIWVSVPRSIDLEDNAIIDFYGLYNVNGEKGFSAYQ